MKSRAHRDTVRSTLHLAGEWGDNVLMYRKIQAKLLADKAARFYAVATNRTGADEQMGPYSTRAEADEAADYYRRQASGPIGHEARPRYVNVRVAVL